MCETSQSRAKQLKNHSVFSRVLCSLYDYFNFVIHWLLSLLSSVKCVTTNDLTQARWHANTKYITICNRTHLAVTIELALFLHQLSQVGWGAVKVLIFLFPANKKWLSSSPTGHKWTDEWLFFLFHRTKVHWTLDWTMAILVVVNNNGCENTFVVLVSQWNWFCETRASWTG